MGLLGVLRRGGRFFGQAESVEFRAFAVGCRQVWWLTGGSEQGIQSKLEVRFEIKGTVWRRRFKDSGAFIRSGVRSQWPLFESKSSSSPMPADHLPVDQRIGD